MWPRFPIICLTVKETLENTQPGNCPDREWSLRTLDERQRRYLPATDMAKKTILFLNYIFLLTLTKQYKHIVASHPEVPGLIPGWVNFLFGGFSSTVRQISRNSVHLPWLSYSPLYPKFAGSNPAGVDGFFQSVKILSMTPFGREVKPWIPCRRFTVCKRT